ncbi:ParA family protein [Glycomyces niveus]|uniref:ParA family protein n=1 Tax=Glycomyces niveus TaxID=2820287 RepID=A0ABS3U4M3_9ACTN|nr:AAA family ATPase [Glycomyces sp. NEAU-S30]MBO3733718.1 ParA family protein [Glycomyces sp. NEAU-S30]
MPEMSQPHIIETPGRVFTWVDVDEHLAHLASIESWPGWLRSVSGWWDAVELAVEAGTTLESVESWLQDAFGAGSIFRKGGQLMLSMDSIVAGKTASLEIIIEENESGSESARRLPLWRERRIVREIANELDRPEDSFLDDMQIVAFHSFKGGVGRTVHAVAYAEAVAKQGKHVLLIDADLEAPGITWMYRSQGRQIDFAYDDFLSLAHGSNGNDISQVVDTAAEFLPNQRVRSFNNGGKITVMPSTRNSDLTPPRIEPADLLMHPSRSPYFLTNTLAELASKFEVDLIVIDLRAGMSELSSPLLLDPRVQRVFVTTLSGQSLDGTEMMIRQLGRRAPSVRGLDPASSVVITQFREDYHGSEVQEAKEKIGRALFDSIGLSQNEDPAVNATDVEVLAQPILSPFREQLLALPRSWDAVVRIISSLEIGDKLDPILPTFPEVHSGPEQATSHPADLLSRRTRLAQHAKALVFAERVGLSNSSGFLAIDPLKSLVGDHRTELPLGLVVGAKGAGKTFLFAKACAAGDWKSFARGASVDGVRVNAPILPVLEPTNLQSEDPTTQHLRDDFARRYAGVDNGATQIEIADLLKDGLLTIRPDDELRWRELWVRTLLAAAGVPLSADLSPFERIIDLGKKARAIFVIDGLEDLLQSVNSESQQTALRVLLTDVVAWLRSLHGRPFGLVVFVRGDLVRRAVPQNSGQLLDRYSRYTLRWDKEDALRLALWVSIYSEALVSDIIPDEVPGIELRELPSKLYGLWGQKMGREKSREARSYLWVPAALSDFHGQVQARDVVGFLAEAARLSQSQADWTDRLLAPPAMRSALFECSIQKIDALKQEFPDVRASLEKLQNAASVTIPFTLDQVDLRSEETTVLVESGVLARDSDGRYWVAEIYRHGLNLKSERRPRVLGKR